MDPQPQCIICHELLSNQSMKLSLLKRHFESKHANLKNKSIKYFKSQLSGLKHSSKIIENFANINEKALEASYHVSLRIAKTGSAHTIGERLILPAIKDVVSLFDPKLVTK